MNPFEAGQVLRGLFPLGTSIKDRPIIIVADEDASGTVIVCTTTDSGVYKDDTTPLSRGCHTLIDVDCTVVYGLAQVADKAMLDALRKGIAANRYRFNPSEKLSSADLRSVQRGLGETDGVPIEQRDLPVGVHRYAKNRGII